MSSSTTSIEGVAINVGMAQVALIGGADIARTVLGSCLGVVLYHRRLNNAAVAHIVLPYSGLHAGPPGKFADTAVPHMLDLLAAEGALRHELVAKVTGGANVLAGSGPMQIGKENYSATARLLRELRLPIVAEHIGGTKGRRVTFEGDTGNLRIETIGEPEIVI